MGALDKLISDCAKAAMSARVKQILCALFNSSWYSEPYHAYQNIAENRYTTIQATTNRVLSCSSKHLASHFMLCLLDAQSPSKCITWLEIS
jgi:hypothetical protein